MIKRFIGGTKKFPLGSRPEVNGGNRVGGRKLWFWVYFWMRTTEPSDENPREVQNSQTCCGFPPAAGIMKLQGRGPPS